MGYKQTEADKTIEKIISFPIIAIGYALYYTVKGIISLVLEKNKFKIIAFLILLLVAVGDILIFYQDIIDHKKYIHIVIELIPLYFLVVNGYILKSDADYDKEFKEISFYTKGEITPKLVYKVDKVNLMGDKYRILIFRTLIPVSKWYSNKESIENIIADPKYDYTHSINLIERAGKKKIKIYTTFDLSSDYFENSKVRIDWNNDLLYKSVDSVIMLGIDKLYLNKVKIDLDDKNILIAGEPGSGKSVELKLIVWQLYKHRWELILSDFKSGAEFNEDFEKIAHVITDRKDFLNTIIQLFKESEERMQLFRSVKKNNIKGYNKSVEVHKRLKRKALVVDELSCPLDKTGMDKNNLKIIGKIEFYLSELARKCRAAGIHLILCMQRPDADILKGQIKNMLGIRISGRFADGVASKIVLDSTMATELPAIQGRMVLKDGANLKEFQGYYFDMEDYTDEIYVKPELEVERLGQIDENINVKSENKPKRRKNFTQIKKKINRVNLEKSKINKNTINDDSRNNRPNNPNERGDFDT